MPTWVHFALAAWPVWVVLAALGVVALASRLGYMAPDEYEDPAPCGCGFGCCCGFCSCCPPRPGSTWMTDEERRYHGDDSVGR